jgi:hypothetical protein
MPDDRLWWLVLIYYQEGEKKVTRRPFLFMMWQ